MASWGSMTNATRPFESEAWVPASEGASTSDPTSATATCDCRRDSHCRGSVLRVTSYQGATAARLQNERIRKND